MAASQLENIHSAYWFWNKRNTDMQKGTDEIDLEGAVGIRDFERVKDDAQGDGVINFMSKILEYNQEQIFWPWVHNNSILAYFYISALNIRSKKGGGFEGYEEAADDDYNDERSLYPPLLGESLKVCCAKDSKTDSTTFFIVCTYLWRFFPDSTSIGISFYVLIYI
jgi:hypothetical protein